MSNFQFNIQSKEFYNCATAVSKVISPKNPMTILTHFRLELKDDVLIITGSDVENSLTAKIPVTLAQGEGSLCVEARKLVDLLKEIPNQGISVKVTDGNKIAIDYNQGQCEFIGVDGSEYPSPQKDDDQSEPVEFVLPAKILMTGLGYTQFAAADEDYRPIMMGVLMDVKADGVTFVATDTRKLVKYTDSTVNPGKAVSRVIPPKPVTILRNIFEPDIDIKVTFTGKSAVFQSAGFIFSCRFLQGNFPDYNRVIPRNNSLTLTVDRQSLLNAVRRVGVFVTHEYGLEKFLITQDNIEIKCYDNNLLTGARETLPCSFNGEKLVMGFSAPYLTAILSTLSSDDITVNLSDPGRPGLFKPMEEPEGTELVMLLMPMTVGEY